MKTIIFLITILSIPQIKAVESLPKSDGFEISELYDFSVNWKQLRGLTVDESYNIFIGGLNNLDEIKIIKLNSLNLEKTEIDTNLSSIPTELLYDEIGSISEEPGNLLIAYSNKLISLNENGNLIDISHKTQNIQISDMCFDKDSNLWFTSQQNEGLYYLRKNGQITKMQDGNFVSVTSINNSIFANFDGGQILKINFEGGGISLENAWAIPGQKTSLSSSPFPIWGGHLYGASLESGDIFIFHDGSSYLFLEDTFNISDIDIFVDFQLLILDSFSRSIKTITNTKDEIEILKQPEGGIGLKGGSFLLNVIVSNTSFPADYQWYFNNIPLPGEVGPELLLSGLEETESGYYMVEILINNYRILSKKAKLTVTNVLMPLISITESKLTINFPTISGKNYFLYQSTNLAEWTQLGDIIFGNDSIISLEISNTENPIQFFKVEQAE